MVDDERAGQSQPTKRELQILNVLWRRGEATVRQVYEELRGELPIVQNTVQAFLRTMEEKGLVRHRLEGRAFVYTAARPRSQAGRQLVGRVLDSVFDGAMDQMVDTLFSHRPPSDDELSRLEELIEQCKRRRQRRQPGEPREDAS